MCPGHGTTTNLARVVARCLGANGPSAEWNGLNEQSSYTIVDHGRLHRSGCVRLIYIGGQMELLATAKPTDSLI